MSRRVIVTNDQPDACHRRVECAIRADMASPAAEFVEQMGSGTWADDPYFTAAPDPEQIYDMAKLVAEMEYVADYGRPSRMSAINHLQDGVWEFRFGKHRVAYFDTPGDGTYAGKPPVADAASLPPDWRDEFWQYPHMDPLLRLTNGFSKTDQKAPQHEVALSVVIRDEDVAHDA